MPNTSNLAPLRTSVMRALKAHYALLRGPPRDALEDGFREVFLGATADAVLCYHEDPDNLEATRRLALDVARSGEPLWQVALGALTREAAAQSIRVPDVAERQVLLLAHEVRVARGLSLASLDAQATVGPRAAALLAASERETRWEPPWLKPTLG